MNAAAPAAAAPRTINPWIVAAAVMASTFMEVLDTTVVNVALPHVAGSLSVSPDEATWALTSYLVANAVVLPMTGWLAGLIGRKRLLMLSVGGFTLSSLLCGLAPNLGFLIAFRIMQGATGGGLQPLSQAIMLEVFPPKDRGKAMAFWGVGIVVAPMLGPVLGGWLTDNWSWRWVFYINLPIGLAALLMTQLFVFDPPYIKRRGERIDYWGLGLLVLGIGALQIMLDKGQQEDWFASRFIIVLAVLAVVGLIGLVVRELRAEHPIIDLRIFKIGTFAAGVGFVALLGFVLYGSTVLVPLLLQTLLGYPALDSGLATLPRGLASFFTLPIIGMLIGRVDPRRLLTIGLLLTTYSLWMLSHINLDAGFPQFVVALFLQGMSLSMTFTPLTTITTAPIPKERMGNATSIYNLMRNIGSSFGVAAVTTMLARRGQHHLHQLAGHVNAYAPAAQERLAGVAAALQARGADAATAAAQARAVVYGGMQRQASMLSYNDAFLILAALYLCLLPLVFLMRRPPRHGGPPAGAH